MFGLSKLSVGLILVRLGLYVLGLVSQGWVNFQANLPQMLDQAEGICRRHSLQHIQLDF
jgi:hypothetical protein